MNLTPVAIATEIVLAQNQDFGTEKVAFEKAQGRVLAESLVADRDFPPFDRVTMDGIAINWQSYAEGQRIFSITAMQAAGDAKKTLTNLQECIEIMTGASLPENTDSVIRYEDLSIENGFAKINSIVKKGQNIHKKGEDRLQNSIIVEAGKVLRSTEIAVAASIGASQITVKKLPKVLIITSGDELVEVDAEPLAHQIRSSNIYCIAILLKDYQLNADFLHITDNLAETEKAISKALEKYDVLILSGGVSKGKKDFIPEALAKNGVEKLFHRLQQQPGKPFWFGRKANKLVFALPGNPVSSFLCARRYFIPWLRKSLGIEPLNFDYAQLSEDFVIKSNLSYFLQVKLFQDKATIMAQPIMGHGSGDLANLVETDAFMELPAFERQEFKKGEVFRVWKF